MVEIQSDSITIQIEGLGILSGKDAFIGNTDPKEPGPMRHNKT
jgi:hypothetical protein